MASSNQAEESSNTVQEDTLLRESLINTAVKFLQNPKVCQSSIATRKAFLKKKGLTNKEVELAIQRSASVEKPLGPHTPHIIPSPLGTPVSYSSSCNRWRNYGGLAIILAGIAFGFRHLYHKYIIPLIMSSKEDKKHLQRIEGSIMDMNVTLTQTVMQLQKTLTSVQEMLTQQQNRIHELSREQANIQASSATSYMVESQSISELKAEIGSLKSLLLSRRQFPASPSLPKIPSWQIPLKPGTQSNSANHTNSSSDISPVSNESTSSSPIKECNHSTTQNMHDINEETTMGFVLPLNMKDQKKVQGEEEIKNKEEVVKTEKIRTHVGDDIDLIVQTEDQWVGEEHSNKHVKMLQHPEGIKDESEVD